MKPEPIEHPPHSEADLNQSSSSPEILNLYRAYITVESTLDAALSPLGLSTAQWSTLRIITENPGISGADIARIAIVSPQAVAAMLQRLEQAGLISCHSPSRGRSLETYLTAQGEALLQEGRQIVNEIEAKIFSDFSQHDREHLQEYLWRCIVNLGGKL